MSHSQSGPTGNVAPPPASGRRTSQGKRRPPPLFWILLAVLVVLILVGLGSIGYYVFLTVDESQPATVSDVWDDLDTGGISAGLAVWSLTDIEPEQLYRQTMASDAVDTAVVQTLTTATLPESQRLGWLTVLARRLAIAGDPAAAAHLNQVAADIAVLEPDLADRKRADALSAVARGWIVLGDEENARTALEAATLIAQGSDELSTPVRRQILEEVASIYDEMGDVDTARTVQALPVSSHMQTATTAPNPLAFLEGDVLYPDDVQQFSAARKAAAQAYVDAWIARGGQAARGDLLALEAALLDEDIGRTGFYAQQLQNPDLDSQQRARILWDKIQWLAIKYRAATGLYGEDLVPNWTAERPAIRQELHDTFLELSNVLLALIETLPPEQQEEARINLYRSVLIWARTGLYPDADQVLLANLMNDASAQWQGASGIVPFATIDDQGNVKIILANMGQ